MSSGCSFETVLKRWPIILTGIIDNIYCRNHDLGVSLPSRSPDEAAIVEERIAEGKKIINQVGQIKYDMARDRVLACVLCLPYGLTFIFDADDVLLQSGIFLRMERR